MKFEISVKGLQTIANYLQMNLDAIIHIEEDMLRVHLYDLNRSRAIVINYPLKITEGSPVTIAINTDWLYTKVRKLAGKTVEIEITDDALIIGDDITIEDVTIYQEHELTLLELEDIIEGTTFEEEPKISTTVECEIPSIKILKLALEQIESDGFYIHADDKGLYINSDPGYSGSSSKSFIETTTIIKDEDNRSKEDTAQCLGFLNGLAETKVTTISFFKAGPIVIESLGKDIKYRFMATPHGE